MMKFINGFLQLHQFLWSVESHYHQRHAWDDAKQARIARAQAEARAAEQHRAMMIANPSGQLGRSSLNDPDSLDESGLL